jgi:acyl carrier protein
MTNLDIYKKVFIECFKVNSDQLDALTYRSISGWDSVGHMHLIAALEEAFGIMLESEDLINFSSYEKGKQIMKKYNVDL